MAGMSPIPNASALISFTDVIDIDEAWINAEINLLEDLATLNLKRLTKDQLVEQLNNVIKEASNISNLLRTVFRLAKEKSNSQTLCTEVIQTLSEKIEQIGSVNSTYADKLKLKLPANKQAPKVQAPTIPNQISSTQESRELSPTAPTFTPSTRHEMTITPEDYNEELKNLHKSLAKSQVSGTRKSRTGNIVLTFPNATSMNEAQGILARDPKIKLHVPKKSITYYSITEQ